MSEEEIERMERVRRIIAEANKLYSSLKRLRFEKIRIKKETEEVRRRLRILEIYTTNYPIPDGFVDEEERDDNKIIVGVEVRITNPHKKQLDQGIVRGFTTNGHTQIYTNDGTLMTRHLKNLRRVKRYQGLDFWDTLHEE